MTSPHLSPLVKFDEWTWVFQGSWSGPGWAWSKGPFQNLTSSADKELIETMWGEETSGINFPNQHGRRRLETSRIRYVCRWRKRARLLIAGANSRNLALIREKFNLGDITNSLWYQFCTPRCHVNTPFPRWLHLLKTTPPLLHLHLWKPKHMMLVVRHVLTMFPNDNYNMAPSRIIGTCLRSVWCDHIAFLFVQAKLARAVCFVLGVAPKPWCRATSQKPKLTNPARLSCFSLHRSDCFPSVRPLTHMLPVPSLTNEDWPWRSRRGSGIPTRAEVGVKSCAPASCPSFLLRQHFPPGLTQLHRWGR